MESAPGFIWKFHRIGGLDHVTLRTVDELRHLGELDPKLWAVLSCPTKGLEFDARTLELLDTDGDGRIRIPEVVAAANWLCACLRDPSAAIEPGDALPLSAINTDTEEGRRLEATARTVLANEGKRFELLSRDDVALALADASEQLLNGDGIVPLHAGLDPELARFIADALNVMGGVADAGGQPGIDRQLAVAFRTNLENWLAWRDSLCDACGPLGEDTAAAWEALDRVKAKIDDYFLRCDLAAFAPRAGAAWADEQPAVPHPDGRGLLDPQGLADLPVARVEAGRPLDLSGLNPVWREPVERLFGLCRPLMDPQSDQPGSLDREGWTRLKDAFASYASALALKPEIVRPDTAFAPTTTPEGLGEGRVRDLLAGDVFTRFDELAERDASTPAATADIAALERLVLYYLDLHRLLMNFVSLYDFYALRRNAAFQAGTLFLDGRACRLCLPVQDVARHAALAAFSELCLVYCACRRAGTGEQGETMNIVAAVTAGDSDLLLEGRNGLFVDNTGRDWDATVVKIVSNPISLRQAVWDPYKRFGRMVTEQIGKLAGARQAGLMQTAGKNVETAGAAATAPPTSPVPAVSGASAPPPAFDIGRSAGIFAAIGLALGALGTALAGITSALFSLRWWQFPLVFLGLFLLISGPSFVLAWLKLRKRTLGPVLEASGWAVNGRIAVNYFLGKALTSTAVLPPNAARSFKDPLGRPSRWPLVMGVVVIALLAGGAIWLWFNPGYLGLPAR